MMMLALLDVSILAFNELFMLVWTLGQRFYGRRQYAQASINAAYEPLEFRFAHRYAYMLKIAAMVLVFAPAAPLLYFIGGGALLVWAAMQKLALCATPLNLLRPPDLAPPLTCSRPLPCSRPIGRCKIYRKPRCLDENIAELSRRACPPAARPPEYDSGA